MHNLIATSLPDDFSLAFHTSIINKMYDVMLNKNKFALARRFYLRQTLCQSFRNQAPLVGHGCDKCLSGKKFKRNAND